MGIYVGKAKVQLRSGLFWGPLLSLVVPGRGCDKEDTCTGNFRVSRLRSAIVANLLQMENNFCEPWYNICVHTRIVHDNVIKQPRIWFLSNEFAHSLEGEGCPCDGLTKGRECKSSSSLFIESHRDPYIVTPSKHISWLLRDYISLPPLLPVGDNS